MRRTGHGGGEKLRPRRPWRAHDSSAGAVPPAPRRRSFRRGCRHAAWPAADRLRRPGCESLRPCQLGDDRPYRRLDGLAVVFRRVPPGAVQDDAGGEQAAVSGDRLAERVGELEAAVADFQDGGIARRALGEAAEVVSADYLGGCADWRPSP